MKRVTLLAGAILLTVSAIVPSSAIQAKEQVKPTAVVQMSESFSQGSVHQTKNLSYTAPEVVKAGVSTLAAKQVYKDVPSGFWAENSIQLATDNGIINGYKDGTFKPNAPVTRAEFVKMVILGTKVSPETKVAGDSWYSPYTKVAINLRWMPASSSTWLAKDWNKPMTRQELALLSARASGKVSTNDDQLILMATQDGLLTGIKSKDGSISLQLDKTTNRAQAVVIIDRVVKIKAGGKLTADKEAVKEATQNFEQQKDAFGEAIRITNLPKNAKDFHYILRDVPNAVYEMKFDTNANSPLIVPPSAVMMQSEITPENFSMIKDSVSTFYGTLFNFNYKTTKKAEFVNTVVKSIYTEPGRTDQVKKFREIFGAYYDWAVEQELISEGSATAIPSIFFENPLPMIRTIFEVKIINTKSFKDAVTIGAGSRDTLFAGNIRNIAELANGYTPGTTLKFVGDVTLRLNNSSSTPVSKAMFHSTTNITYYTILSQ